MLIKKELRNGKVINLTFPLTHGKTSFMASGSRHHSNTTKMSFQMTFISCEKCTVKGAHSNQGSIWVSPGKSEGKCNYRSKKLQPTSQEALGGGGGAWLLPASTSQPNPESSNISSSPPFPIPFTLKKTLDTLEPKLQDSIFSTRRKGLG